MVLVSDVYQSRTDNEAAIILRQDPVVYPGPDEQGEFALSEHQLRGYRKNGFIHLRGLLSEAEAGELLREAKQFNPREFRILASQIVVDMFLEEESQHLAMLGDFIGKPISLQVETVYQQEQYDIILM